MPLYLALGTMRSDCFAAFAGHTPAVEHKAVFVAFQTKRIVVAAGRRKPWAGILVLHVVERPMPIETEIKFYVAEIDALVERLQEAEFHLETPRSFERNVLYDTTDRQLRARTEILRVRSYAGRWTLTHKRLPVAGPGEDRHKHRIETETNLENGKALHEIFLSLGFVPAFRYEKWRAEWSDGQGHCVIDETPIGNYAELEGAPGWIDTAAARLGVDPAQYVTLSYGRLFENWIREHRSSAQNLTFDEVGSALVR